MSNDCDDEITANLDLASLEEDTLSPEGMNRLAEHLVKCPGCLTLFFWMVTSEADFDARTLRRIVALWRYPRAWAYTNAS